MFGAFAVFYLFLGGAGAGAIAACSLIDLLAVKQPFGTSSYGPGPSVRPLGRIVDYGFLAGFVALAVGIVSLLLDLGRIDRALALFLSPTMSVMTLGSYALAALGVLGAALVLVRFMYLPFVKRSVVVALEAIAVAVALVVMLYTGLLLQSLGAVPLWSTPWLPALFAASSLSCGIERHRAFVRGVVLRGMRPCLRPRTSRARLRGCGSYRARSRLRCMFRRACGAKRAFRGAGVVCDPHAGRAGTCVVARVRSLRACGAARRRGRGHSRAG